jgi:hypothetical protein
MKGIAQLESLTWEKEKEGRGFGKGPGNSSSPKVEGRMA